MGNIVKYCSSCEEGFAEKFGFCPNCGASLQSFEMKRVDAQAETKPVVKAETAPPAPVISEPVANVEPAAAEIFTAPAIADVWSQPEIIEAPVEEIEADVVEAAPETVEEVIEEPKPEPVVKKAAKAAVVAAAAPVFSQARAIDADRKPKSFEAEHKAYADAGGFYVTVIEEKNVNQRNGLLLGTLVFMIVGLLGGTVYSLFAKDLSVGSIDGGDLFMASILDDVPMPVDEVKQEKEKKDAGGGGGGGRKEEQEVNKGDMADQTPKPIRPPDVHVPRLDNPELLLPPPSTVGDKKFEKKFDRYGDPNGRFDTLSNGSGSGNGIGSGRGNGQGNGNGDGAGNGNGTGFGNGDGNGNGNGRGNGTSSDGAPPPERKVGVTQDIKIMSKPKPGYTDAARQANIQGTVILRVTFTANGQIGAVSTVKGLPNGLTENAIACAKRISFEPRKVDGIGQTVTKNVEYSFSIY